MYAKIIDLKVGDRVRNSRLGEGVVIKALGTFIRDYEGCPWDEKELVVSYKEERDSEITWKLNNENPYCLQYYECENNELEFIPNKPRHQRIPTKYQPWQKKNFAVLSQEIRLLIPLGILRVLYLKNRV